MIDTLFYTYIGFVYLCVAYMYSFGKLSSDDGIVTTSQMVFQFIISPLCIRITYKSYKIWPIMLSRTICISYFIYRAFF
jgi:hypothetical protein